ncbi:MAG: hypothetical protein QG613_335, partial [Pseudomonadota bacterium]|nr:hypothetical protein [Pseudomonadota bacterium]
GEVINDYIAVISQAACALAVLLAPLGPLQAAFKSAKAGLSVT